MENTNYMDLLRGQCQTIPDVRSKVVRVFLSSTFTDTLAERDSLIQIVFPKLKDYCRQQYHLEFQYVDMRWGIPNESSNNHSEVQTCLHEIEICKRYSVATNFIVLLSHRYGSRPTPSIIPSVLFNMLYEQIQSEMNDDDQLLSQWYRLDTNCIPSVYVLQSISSNLANINSQNTNEMKQAEKEWKRINDRIRTCLRKAASRCFEQKQINQDEYDEFFISITEKEILKGILEASDANERTLCFIREIEDINEHLFDSKASKYIDIGYSKDNEPILDSEAEMLLNNLKYSLIPKKLQSSNIFSYKVHWTSSGINRDDHNAYLTRFNDDFYYAIKQQIDQCIQSRILINSNPLEHEVIEHAIQSKTHSTKFHGRIDILDRLKEYVLNENEHRACVIYGDSGCGKTSVLAKTSFEVLKWWSTRSVSVILRFLGTTPLSSTIHKTLVSISEQICQIYNLSMTIYPDVLQLRYQLETNLFPKIPVDEYLLLIFDSIDQLSKDAYNCQWLPKIFPKNIKCIISTLPDHGDILSNLKSIINSNQLSNENCKHLFILVPAFNSSMIEIIYKDWFERKQRTLSNEQYLFVIHWMKERITIVPLFMKLVFDILCTLHSYDTIDNRLKTCRTVDDCILYLFNQLQIKHNNVLFRRGLSYMTACRNGITQNELEDVLSIDDDVLKSVFEHYIPPIKRLPGILWTRIRNDLDEYITEKEVDDSSVIYWYHRRFIEIVNTQYLSKSNEAERTIIFSNMIDLYSETWNEKIKPLKIDNKKLIEKYHLFESNGEILANRLITSQPIEFIDSNGQISFNKRKLNELPQFLFKLSPNLAIPIAINEVFFNYAFMYAKTRCSNFDDIAFVMQHFKDIPQDQLSKDVLDMKNEIDILLMIYMIVGPLLEEYPDNYVYEFSSRLLNFFGIKPNITHLIKQFDEKSIYHCSLIVPYCQIQPPGSGLVYSMTKHTTSINHIDLTNDQLAGVSLSDRIVIIDMTTGRTALDIKLPKLNESYLNCTTFNHHLSYAKNYRQYRFLVNSFHHIYFVSADDEILFERTSKNGFMIVEVLDFNRALCIIKEIDKNFIECWDLIHNRQLTQLDESSSSIIKYIFCIHLYKIIAIIYQDGLINFYSIDNSNQPSFIECGSIEIEKNINLIVVDRSALIYTYDNNTSIDFVHINLKNIFENKNHFVKTSITFDEPIGSKSIKQIVLSSRIRKDIESLDSLLFIGITTNCLYVIHQCTEKKISHVRIDGYFDIVAMHENSSNTIYTARGGIINIFVWKCVQTNECSLTHTYELYASIDISSSPVTRIKPIVASALSFLCSMANGAIHIYETEQLHEAYKTLVAFPRTNNEIRNTQLYNTIAVTLDNERRELSIWSYQNSTSIDSTRLYSDQLMINEFAITSNKFDSNMIFIFLILNNHRIEIYLCELLHNEPVFTLQLQSSSRVHSTKYGDFLLVTNTGSLSSIVQQSNSYDNIKFHQTNNVQMNIQCSNMFSSIVTLNSNEHLIIFDDTLQSIVIWTNTQLLIYININHSQILSSILSKVYSDERTQDTILLHFSDKSLVLCQIKLNEFTKNGSVEMITLDTTDLFCQKNYCLATVINNQNQLNLRNLRSEIHYHSIQLENICEQICLNESATYVFTLIKPRILFMHRIDNSEQMAKLFLYDYVISLRVNENFVVLAMNDRRLLTLMIADPHDPNLQNKIQALPSRNSRREIPTATLELLQHIERYANMDLHEDIHDVIDVNEKLHQTSESDDDDSSDGFTGFTYFNRVRHDKKLAAMKKQSRFISSDREIPDYLKKVELPTSSPASVMLQRMGDDTNDIRQKVIEIEVPSNSSATVTEKPMGDDMNDIRQKVIEYEQQQVTGVQLANVGNQNLKIINNYSVTSNTCSLL